VFFDLLVRYLNKGFLHNSSMNERQSIKSLLPLIRLYPWSMPTIVGLGIFASLAEGFGITLFFPFFQMFDRSTYQSLSDNTFLRFLSEIFGFVPNDYRLVVIPGFIFGAILIKNVLTFGNLWIFGRLNSRISHRLRCDTFDQIMSLSGSYLDAMASGRLFNTLASETWRTSEALEAFVRLIINGCTVLVFTILLLLISFRFTLLIGLIMVLISFTVKLVTRRVRTIGQEAVKANASLAKRMHEGMAGIRDIWAFGREGYEQERFGQTSKGVQSTFFRLGILSGVVDRIYEVLSAGAILGILLVILLQDRAALPFVLTFLLILYRLQPQIQQLDANRVKLRSLGGSVQELTSFLDRSDKPYISSGPAHFQGLMQGISLDSLTFRYDSQKDPALHDISIMIPQGKTTAFVGPSGSGKSTLVNLICRFYDATEGEIYADGVPLRKFNLPSWRRRIAIVSQHSYIFDAKIGENIAYGRLGATRTEVVAAAKKADAHEFISRLPRGYDSEVGERGIRLSGGQRQRIALARAIVRDPGILILDEATNALDSISERVIQEAVDTFSHNRTVIVIAHRLSTIKKADQIIVLEDGRVVEQGNIKQLLNMKGFFAKLYRLQYEYIRA
jgi:subfamily B ATP-binding cassette protein MsbA